jgi:hypothetical protein
VSVAYVLTLVGLILVCLDRLPGFMSDILSIFIYSYLYYNLYSWVNERQPAPGVGKEILVNVPMELESELSSTLAGLEKQKAGLNTEQKHVEKTLINID